MKLIFPIFFSFCLLTTLACTKQVTSPMNQLAFFDINSKAKSITETLYEAVRAGDQSWQQVDSSSSSTINEYTFNVDGENISSKIYRDGMLVDHMEKQYDRHDNVSALHLDEQGNIKSEVRTIIDTEEEKSFEAYLPTGQISSRSRLFFKDGENIGTEAIFYNADGSESQRFSSELEHNADGTIHAFLIRSSLAGDEPSRSKMEYLAFDERGSWTKKVVVPVTDGKPQIIIRTIEYYD